MMISRLIQGAALLAILGLAGRVDGSTVMEDCPVVFAENCVPQSACSDPSYACDGLDEEYPGCNYGGECWNGCPFLPFFYEVKCCDESNCI
jgi:hypothetical protein